MKPNISVPTDNIYKFCCLFGLAIIISSIFSFVAIYTSTLDSKIKYANTVINLQTKENRSKSEDELLKLNKKLIDVAKSNEETANTFISITMSVGILLSIFGAEKWYRVIQKRDDKISELQVKKLELEIKSIAKQVSRHKVG